MIVIDGSMMEGGGQLLRMATTYSAILHEPVRVTSIRAKRKEPGLKPQHRTTLSAVAEMCGARVTGLEIGSTEVTFQPDIVAGGAYNFDIGTAGSTSLLLQCTAPVACYADSTTRITVKGGTAVRWSPPIPIVEKVVWRGFRLMGFKGHSRVLREGFHPRGGGLVQSEIDPITGFKPITGERAQVKSISGISISGGLPRHVAERQADAAKKIISEEGYEVNIDVATPGRGSEPYSPGSLICLWVEGDALIGTDGLGERGKPAEKIGEDAAKRLLELIETRAYVDLHTADNLILPCSLAEGKSAFTLSKITMHTLTAIEIARLMTRAELTIDGSLGETGKITCVGMGAKNRQLGS